MTTHTSYTRRRSHSPPIAEPIHLNYYSQFIRRNENCCAAVAGVDRVKNLYDWRWAVGFFERAEVVGRSFTSSPTNIVQICRNAIKAHWLAYKESQGEREGYCKSYISSCRHCCRKSNLREKEEENEIRFTLISIYRRRFQYGKRG